MRIRNKLELFAAVPHILGFYPQESIVCVVFDGDSVLGATDLDLPEPDEGTQGSVTTLVDFATSFRRVNAVAYLVYCDRAERDPDVLPHTDLIDGVTSVTASANLAVRAAMWLRASTPGSAWECYCACGDGGVLPDLRDQPISAACIADGSVVWGSKKELKAQLEPLDDDVLATRATLLTRVDKLAPKAAWWHVQNAVAEAATRQAPLTDEEAVNLTAALSSGLVRDASMSLAFGAYAAAAESLFRELARGGPGHHRADAAALTGVSALVRDDLTFTRLAVHVALHAHPVHLLATSLLRVLNGEVPQSDLVAAIVSDSHKAARLLESGVLEPPTTQ